MAKMNSKAGKSKAKLSTSKSNPPKNSDTDNDEDKTKDWKPHLPLSVLTKVHRAEMIVRHRTEFSCLADMILPRLKGITMKLQEATPQSDSTIILNRLPPFFQKLRPLALRNMNPYDCKHHPGRLDLELIEDPQEFTRVMLLGQDNHGDVTFVALYCEPTVLKDCLFSLSKIGFGCKISIVNPLYKIALDGRKMIPVEKEKNIFFWDGKDDEKCRFCSKVGDSPHKCGRCEKAFYCSKECETLDWNVLGHEMICGVYQKAYAKRGQKRPWALASFMLFCCFLFYCCF